ncbi:hypothetical protein FHS97_000605 [Sphingomonas endophytica]|uniref:Uncharacterized protein n=1 Tax=Sphingomonas endophytica TaxID=869719 RepID=A0ABR6N1N6_9SPHN|nr:hypothetical protein [Sphingomonas endophytica]MBB5724697.1 hypothetical protein [Sphingomonas endophytica]
MAPFLRRATHDRNANQYQIAKVLFLQAPLTEGMRPAVSNSEQMPQRPRDEKRRGYVPARDLPA